MAAASEVPGRYDVVINGQGYIFDRTRDGSRSRAEYGYTNTFLERTNVSGAYGDDQQSFWLTASQRDWSLGEGQKFFRSSDADKTRQFWSSAGVDISTAGQIALPLATTSISIGATVFGGIAIPNTDKVYVWGTTNLFEVTNSGLGATVDDRGAHGLGVQPTCATTDGTFVYLSSGSATKVRKFDTGAHTFADFSAATAADSLAYLNNTVYGTLANVLNTYSTAGVAAASFTWKTGTGAALPGTMKIIAFGGKVIVMRVAGNTNGTELWQYDGTGVSKIAELGSNFQGADLCQSLGIIYIAGTETIGAETHGAVWFSTSSGQIGRAYRGSATTGTSAAVIGAFGSGFLFSGDLTGSFTNFYDVSSGAISSPTGSLGIGSLGSIAPARKWAALIPSGGNTVIGLFISSSNFNTSGTLTTSLFDFDSSLQKVFRGITVDWSKGLSNEGSVDISYQVDGVDGSFTSLQVGAVSGTEYLFPTVVTGHALSVKLTIHGSSPYFYTPIVKRLYVRAAPLLTSFKVRTYNLDLTNVPDNPSTLQDGSTHSLTGHEQAVNLAAAITSTTPITITDRFGTYTAVIEPGQSNISELHSDSGGGLPANSGQFTATIMAREV